MQPQILLEDFTEHCERTLGFVFIAPHMSAPISLMQEMCYLRERSSELWNTSAVL